MLRNTTAEPICLHKLVLENSESIKLNKMATRWGIASVGLISHDFVTALATLPAEDHRVVAVAARDSQRAQAFALLHSIPKVCASYADLAKNPDVDVVYVGTINPYHFEVSKLMLEHGKHVLCEKPLTMSEEDTSKLVKLAREKKLFLMEAIWSRFFPAYQLAHQEVKAGAIGDVVQINANFCEHFEVERVKKKELGGGTIFDLAVYVLQLPVLIFGPQLPLTVKAVGHVNENGVDESTAIILTYPGSKTAVLSTSVLANMSNDAVIYGTKGSIKLVDPFWSPTTVIVSDNSTETKVQTIREFPLPEVRHKLNFINSCGLRYEADEVRRCIKEGLIESPGLTHDESVTIAKLQQMIHDQLGIKFS